MLNNCQFIGRLGRDPENRSTPSGKSVTTFSLAVSEKRGGNDNTEWINVVCWEKTADFVANYMTKGQLAFVSGRMCTRKWQDKEGNDKYTTEIIAQTVQNLSPKSDGTQQKESDREYQHSTGDSVPF